jgi:hypothetical protein
MKFGVVFLFLIFTIACGAQTGDNQKRAENPQSEITNPQAKQAVLVELFTSEG